MGERATLRALDEFQAFVRPVRYPHLTAFCTRLTSIQQADVDAAEGFTAVLAAFRAWISRHHVVGWGSWGRYDQTGRPSGREGVWPYVQTPVVGVSSIKKTSS